MQLQNATREQWQAALQQADLFAPLTDTQGQVMTSERLKLARALGNSEGPTYREKGTACTQHRGGKHYLPRIGCAFCGVPAEKHRP